MLGLSACAHGKRASVTPGTMPPSGSFSGLWFSPQYGEMRLIQQGNKVRGNFEKEGRKGRIEGELDGDVLYFRWYEKRLLVKAKPGESRGRGYFKFAMGLDRKQYLIGEWGHDDDEIGGGPWRAYKMREKAETKDQGGFDAEELDPTIFSGDKSDSTSGQQKSKKRNSSNDDALEGLDEY